MACGPKRIEYFPNIFRIFFEYFLNIFFEYFSNIGRLFFSSIFFSRPKVGVVHASVTLREEKISCGKFFFFLT